MSRRLATLREHQIARAYIEGGGDDITGTLSEGLWRTLEAGFGEVPTEAYEGELDELLEFTGVWEIESTSQAILHRPDARWLRLLREIARLRWWTVDARYYGGERRKIERKQRRVERQQRQARERGEQGAKELVTFAREAASDAEVSP